MGFFKEDRSMTYKEKEIINEAIKILNMYDRSCKISMGMAMNNTKKFLRSNFDLDNKSERSDAWKIKQYNRNRNMEDQISTIKEFDEIQKG